MPTYVSVSLLASVFTGPWILCTACWEDDAGSGVLWLVISLGLITVNRVAEF